MTNVTITNGTIKYGRTIKTGDFESKRGDVELSFTIAEGTDADEAISHVESTAIRHVFDILGHKEDSVAKPAKAAKPEKAPKMPAVAAKVEEALKGEPAEEKAPPFVEKEIAAANKKAAEATDEGLDDLLGETAPTVVAAITDKELTDAVTKCQSANHNAPAIRKIVNDLGVKNPPGRIIDLPQNKRKEFLELLKDVKPLA